MKNNFLTLNVVILLVLGAIQLEARKMTRDITHSIPWIETRLSYAMTVEELAEMYYGNSTETGVILAMNESINTNGTMLRKNMTVLVPVTSTFTDQPELLGWVQ